MALEMKTRCEECGKKLTDDAEAYICSYECTYCRSCMNHAEAKCPKCRGALVARPRRDAKA